MGEAHFSAEQPQQENEAWLPSPDEHARRSGDYQVPPRPWSGQTVGLSIESIRDQKSFQLLRSHGKRVSVGDLWVVAVVGTGQDSARLAFAIGRTVGNAVVRNRLRRRLRALLSTEVHPRPGVYLVGARPGAGQRSFNELAVMMSTIFSRLERLS